MAAAVLEPVAEGSGLELGGAVLVGVKLGGAVLVGVDLAGAFSLAECVRVVLAGVELAAAASRVEVAPEVSGTACAAGESATDKP